MKTEFAPADRSKPEVLEKEIYSVEESPLIQVLLRVMDGYVLVLNRHRQVLAANTALWKDLGLEAAETLEGRRPGEMLGCVHVDEGPEGCGTAHFCSTCGCVKAVRTSLEAGDTVTEECLLTCRRGENETSMELQVRSTPVSIPPHEFLVVSLQDISGRKRKEALERLFIHDLLNTVGGLKGWSQVMESIQDETLGEAAQRIVELSSRLTDEILDQRILLQAERGDLKLSSKTVPVEWILSALKSAFSSEESLVGRRIQIEQPSGKSLVFTDVGLLHQVLKRMVRNAIEASQPGMDIRVWFEDGLEGPLFHVWNPGFIPESAAMRIFQRSFSTKKERGRGLGTYAMKLIVN